MYAEREIRAYAAEQLEPQAPRIDQYRITFRWEAGNAYEVRVEDYQCTGVETRFTDSDSGQRCYVRTASASRRMVWTGRVSRASLRW